MDNNQHLTELTYLAEAVTGHDARKGEGSIVFMLPSEAQSDAARGSINFPADPTPENLKAWALERTQNGRLESVLTEARDEASKLDGDRSGIAMRVIRALEAHILDGLGEPSDLADAHSEIFGFDLVAVDHTTALEKHRKILSELGIKSSGPLHNAYATFQEKLPTIQSCETNVCVEETLMRCRAAGINLIEDLNFNSEKRKLIIRKIEEITHEVRSDFTYAGKASMKGDKISITIRPSSDQTSLQLTVIHEFTHALQMLLRQLGFEEGSLHFEDLLSIAGSGSVALDEGLADLHSHDTLQIYSTNQVLVKTIEGGVDHLKAAFRRRQEMRVNIAFALQQGEDDAAIRELITAHEFSPQAVGFYLGMTKEGTPTNNQLYVPSYYHGGQLFVTRWNQDPQRAVREFLHMEGSNDYHSLASK